MAAGDFGRLAFILAANIFWASGASTLSFVLIT